MEWYREAIVSIEEDNLEIDDLTDLDFEIERHVSTALPELQSLEEDIILQWIVSPFVSGDQNLVFQIPVPDQRIQSYVMEITSGFFATVETIYENKRISMIRVSEIKEEVIEKFKNKSLLEQTFNPVIRDLYMRESISMVQENITCKNFEIISDKFCKMNSASKKESNNKLWNFLKSTHIDKEGSMVMTPKNWLFNDDLLKSPALNYFALFADKIILTVNMHNQHVRAIEIK
ncbi:hypothetical protein P4H71_01480 [Paenibacillus kribbensis]|uniref:hypothetical protein n=1 Tax=Paenibacillus kribbensis TaxID=172713 RepID=UPI002DBB167A|nr:hypothetical protein [Paenibacillus kribbensis]MEC0233028.1 hypothetical protein [Paenibacillus kribbensis]